MLVAATRGYVDYTVDSNGTGNLWVLTGTKDANVAASWAMQGNPSFNYTGAMCVWQGGTWTSSGVLSPGGTGAGSDYVPNMGRKLLIVGTTRYTTDIYGYSEWEPGITNIGAAKLPGVAPSSVSSFGVSTLFIINCLLTDIIQPVFGKPLMFASTQKRGVMALRYTSSYGTYIWNYERY
jgi:hypothetical protein